jgi:predicted kinase
VIAKDEIKEYLFDTIGFRCYEEKTALDIAASNIMMYSAARILDAGCSVILDNNFEDRNMDNLKKLVAGHPCNVVTVRFNCDIEEAYRRFVLRDKDPSRHPGHVLNTCYPPVEGVVDETKYMTMEKYAEKYRRRGTMVFSFGKLLEVDATDFNSVSYVDIMRQLETLLVRG